MPRKASEYLRVTEVISFVNSSWLQYWYKSVGVEEAERIGKESAAFGTGLHKIVEAFLLNQPQPEQCTDRQRFCSGLMIEWIKQTNAQPILIENKPAIECSLKSEKYKLTGHPDAVVTFGNRPELFILDWKSSKSMKPDYKLQLAAYAMMLKEQHGLLVDDGAIIRTPNDPNVMPQFEVMEVHDLKKKYLPVFLDALNVCQYFKGKGKYKKIKGV